MILTDPFYDRRCQMETQHPEKRYRRRFCFLTKTMMRKENKYEKIEYASLRRLIAF